MDGAAATATAEAARNSRRGGGMGSPRGEGKGGIADITRSRAKIVVITLRVMAADLSDHHAERDDYDFRNRVTFTASSIGPSSQRCAASCSAKNGASSDPFEPRPLKYASCG